MHIKCPYCGVRPVEEFTMTGDAARIRPASTEPADMDEWHDYVYLRENPKGRLEEYWHHDGGCRSWLVVERNTVTHEVYSVKRASDHVFERQQAAKKTTGGDMR